MCVQHAFLEGKKAEETPPRKSTPRTLKGVDQQYPPVFGTRNARGNFLSMPRTETQSTNQRRVGGERGSFWTACGRSPPRSRKRRQRVGFGPDFTRRIQTVCFCTPFHIRIEDGFSLKARKTTVSPKSIGKLVIWRQIS